MLDEQMLAKEMCQPIDMKLPKTLQTVHIWNNPSIQLHRGLPHRHNTQFVTIIMLLDVNNTFFTNMGSLYMTLHYHTMVASILLISIVATCCFLESYFHFFLSQSTWIAFPVAIQQPHQPSTPVIHPQPM